MSRRAPRTLGATLSTLTQAWAPASLLAQVQAVWSDAMGPLAQRATPLRESEGVLTLGCSEAVWAQELELMGPELCDRLNAALGRVAVTAVRCRATGT